MTSEHTEASTPTEPNEFEVFNANIDIHKLPIYTRMELAEYDGVFRPQIYVAINGYVYDVSNNAKSYGPGKAYHKLVGKDVSRLLGLNKLKVDPKGPKFESPFYKDNTWTTTDLSDKQKETVEKWVLFFKKRYNIVGLVVDHDILTGEKPDHPGVC